MSGQEPTTEVTVDVPVEPLRRTIVVASNHDAELDAMTLCLMALHELDKAARCRVTKYLFNRVLEDDEGPASA
jgi:hypothetical protein